MDVDGAGPATAACLPTAWPRLSPRSPAAFGTRPADEAWGFRRRALLKRLNLHRTLSISTHLTVNRSKSEIESSIGKTNDLRLYFETNDLYVSEGAFGLSRIGGSTVHSCRNF